MQTNCYEDDHGCINEHSANMSLSLGVPSSITLRKASAEIVSQTAGHRIGFSSKSRSEFNQSRLVNGSKSPNSELVAFKSNLLTGSDTRSTASENATDHENTITRASSGSQRKIDKERIQNLVSFDQSATRSRSTTISTALTVTDVCVAPGTFAIDPKSRKTSVAFGPLSRRLSLVQFRSQSSVHEIIWREDESPCDSCSSKNSSPQEPGLLSREASISKGELSGSKNASQADSPRHKSRSSLGLKGDLFQWSWSKKEPPSSARLRDDGDQPAEIDNLMPHDSVQSNESQSSTQSEEEHDRERIHGYSVSVHDSVSSFPPLNKFHSTADARRSTNTSINDPGSREAREEPDSVPQRADSTSLDSEIAKRREVQSRIKRANTHPDVPARTGESGRTGSSIGSSSGQRLSSKTRLSVS